MYRQKESELNAIFRDKAGHRHAVQLKLIWATLIFAALILVNVATDYRFLVFTLFFFVVPLHLLFAGLSEIVYLRRAKARQLDGFDDLPPLKSSRKMTAVIFGGAFLIIFVTMGSPYQMHAAGGPTVLGPLIFLVIIGYRIYLAIFRPDKRPEIASSRQEALSQSGRVAGQIFKGATLHFLMTAIIFVGLVFYLFFWQDVGGNIEDHLYD